ncbi:hypothetical protein WJX79_004676 [Trebouxia sp. C0005]
MASTAGQSPITVYTPHVPAGASESDAARFLQLCDLARRRFRKQPGKESLEQAAQDAGLKGDVYYTGPKPWEPKATYKILQPREVVVAKILEKEGRLTAIPAGWLTVPPVVLKWPKGLTPPAAVSADSQAAPQEESTGSDSVEVQQATAFMAEYKSHRDLQEPGQYALYRNVVQEQSKGGSTFCAYKDPLARLAYIKENLSSVSSEDRNLTVLLRKPCLDITMWAGYDPKDSQKNLDYYKTWNKRFVASPEHGNNTVDDIYNKYQDWSRSVRKGFVGPITCIQDLLDFYVWYAQRMSSIANGALTVSRSWEHISLLGYFHGYIKASEWQQGRYIPAEAMHGITFRRDVTRQANINAKEVAQTAEDGYEASNKKYLEDSEMAEISASLWNSKSADDCLLYHGFSSFGSQTLIRDTELLLLQRVRSCLSESSQYQTSFGPLKLMEVVSKGAQKTNKTNLLYSWMIRRRQIDHSCPFFWGAVRLFHDYQRMQPGKPGNRHGSLVEVMRDRPAVTVERPSRSDPLMEVKRIPRDMANMMPLMSGRVGTGPMDSLFRFCTAANFSKQILQPVLGSKLLGIKDRVKGASLRLLRQSAMRRMLFFGAVKPILKSVSKHDPDNANAMDTFYALFCPGEYIQCIMMSAGYADMDYRDFRWQKHYVHGRGVYGIERIQQERPDVWKIISEQLAPGLEEWVQAVMDRGLHGLTGQALKAANQVKLQWHLLEVFLQDSAVHFFEHRQSQVYLQLPIFQNAVFVEWLLGDFRQVILQLEHEADVCYRHIVSSHRSGTVLDSLTSNRPPVATKAEQEALLHEMYKLVTSDAECRAAALKAKAEKAAEAAAIEAAEDKKPQPGQRGVITMPPRLDVLADLWEAWEEGWSGCEKLRIYKTDPSVYPRDAALRGPVRWLRGEADQDAWQKVKELLTILDCLVRARKDNRYREAKRVIKKWEDSLFSNPACLVSSVPELRTALKDYGKGNDRCLAKQGSTTKRNHDGTLKCPPQYIGRAQLAEFFDLVRCV